MAIDKESRAQNRPKRVPLHQQKVLDAHKRPGYVRRWVNETPEAIAAYEAAGYELVSSTEDNSAQRAQTETNLGSSVARKVVNRDPNARTRHAVLMEIKEEYYKEDQAAKQAKVDAVEKSYDPEKFKNDQDGFYGTGLTKTYS